MSSFSFLSSSSHSNEQLCFSSAIAMSPLQAVRSLTSSPEPVEEHVDCPMSFAMIGSPLQAAVLPSPSPKSGNIAPMKGRCLRSSKGHTHHLDARPSTVPEPTRTGNDTWLFEVSDRKLWVRSQKPVDWKQVGRSKSFPISFQIVCITSGKDKAQYVRLMVQIICTLLHRERH